MTPEPLKSAHRKLARAKLHTDNFKREAEAFLNGCPREFVIDPDPKEPRHRIHKLRFKNQIPDALFDEMGDAIHNLRSALDNACFGIAVAVHGNPKPLNALFPFGGSLVEFENNMRGRCKDIPEELFPVFRAYEPYKGGDDVLWAFNRIAVADKHTILRISLASQLGNVTGTGGIIRMHLTPPWDSTKNEIEIGTFAFGVGLYYKAEIGLTIAFHRVEVVEDEPVLAILDYLTGRVENFLTVVELETRRLFPSAFV